MKKLPEIYTQENVVFQEGLEAADITRPVKVYTDSAGNHALSDGNHRAVKAFREDRLGELPRSVIGHIDRNVASDFNYRTLGELAIIETRHPEDI